MQTRTVNTIGIIVLMYLVFSAFGFSPDTLSVAFSEALKAYQDARLYNEVEVLCEQAVPLLDSLYKQLPKKTRKKYRKKRKEALSVGKEACKRLADLRETERQFEMQQQEEEESDTDGKNGVME